MWAILHGLCFFFLKMKDQEDGVIITENRKSAIFINNVYTVSCSSSYGNTERKGSFWLQELKWMFLSQILLWVLYSRQQLKDRKITLSGFPRPWRLMAVLKQWYCISFYLMALQFSRLKILRAVDVYLLCLVTAWRVWNSRSVFIA